MNPITRKLMMERIADHPKLELMPFTKLIAFSPEGVRAIHKGKGVAFAPFDTIILYSGMEPGNSLAEKLKEFKGEMRIIGDAAEPANIETAFEQGLPACNTI